MTDTERLLLTRSLPVPAARAFAAWTDARQAARWWGGWEPGTEPHSGGVWRFAMSFDGKTQRVGGTNLDHDISLGSTACEEGWGWSLGCLVDHLTALVAAGD